MENANNTHSLKVEKVIPKPASEVFRAIGEGRLFLNCSADQDSMKVDFRVGGKYSIQFSSFDKKNGGEFLEIVQNQKIVFTWCPNPLENTNPDTTVTVELKDLGGKTALTLTHTGFKNTDIRDAHQGGWNGGLEDLSQEITVGKLRFMRSYSMSMAKLYEKCKNPVSFFSLIGEPEKGKVDFKVGGKFEVPTEKGSVSGEFLEIDLNQKIVFNWNSTCEDTHGTKVTLAFDIDDDDENSCWLELTHEGLKTEAQQKSHRGGWDYVLKNLK